MKRSTRSRLIHLGLYAVLIALVIVVALAGDWATVGDYFFNPDVVAGAWKDMVFIGVVNTLMYTAIAFSGGLALALVLALMKLSPILLYRWVATAYIEFFRGLPALIVILAMAFAVPIAFQWTPPGGLVGAGLLALIMVAGAYMAETLRAGIQAVPKGQEEASRSLGMSSFWTTISVVLPQAFRIVIPPLTNEFVLLIKDTALLFVIGVGVGQRELTSVGRDFMSGEFSGNATTLTMAAVMYLIITLPLTQLVAWLERRQMRAAR
ncbi:amino acid ABC transporter permease [Nocardioides sp.]|uniref:amino acid ABC transporter permease n=1 Tax=Nocardioides sp. TaxID=35761 RepID=UPI002CF22613|nr:amino acid ABC transporter permease [Nocardioides sp.]HSX68082.1 amino acid ABC transporter permease [Nocardioides sp.]